MKLALETRKILALPDLPISMTCVRVPVRVGHSASMLVETERPLTPEAARAALAAFPGVEVVDDPARNEFPTALDVDGRDEVLVGRIRKDLGSDRLWLWQVSDNLRKGAATNAVQIAEEMIRRGLK
jgi:aspartate-semialdehyde dehydrogenase